MAVSSMLVFISYIIFINTSGLVLALFNIAGTIYYSARTAYIADTKRALRRRIISISDMLGPIIFRNNFRIHIF